LPLGASACAVCDPGTYSIGGGYKFSNWETMPDGFKTLCRFQLDADTTQECSGWILNGTFVYSGDMRGKRLMDSILQYKGEWTSEGSVEFEYRVDAERKWDGLFFQIDGVKVMEIDSYKFQYNKVSYKLTPGMHTLEWVYHKDVAYEMGEDTAWIRSITVRRRRNSLASPPPPPPPPHFQVLLEIDSFASLFCIFFPLICLYLCVSGFWFPVYESVSVTSFSMSQTAVAS
jgi:hypothetical protein